MSKRTDYYEYHESRQELEQPTKFGRAHRRWLEEGLSKEEEEKLFQEENREGYQAEEEEEKEDD